jgi:hypothetical protein
MHSEDIQNIRRQIKILERLAGTLVITDENTIITVQRADRDKQYRQLHTKSRTKR